MTGTNVSIRPATAADAQDAAPLIALAMGKIGPILFGGGDPARSGNLGRLVCLAREPLQP